MIEVRVTVGCDGALETLLRGLVAALENLAGRREAAAFAPDEPEPDEDGKTLAPAEAPEPRPEQPPPAAPPKRGAWCTAERRAILRRDWPAGVPTEEIRARLRACPGPPLPDGLAIASRAADLGLFRPHGQRGGSDAPAAEPAAPEPPKEPVAADFWQIMAWAAVRGIQFDGTNLAEVNAKRAALGLAPFSRLIPGAKRAA